MNTPIRFQSFPRSPSRPTRPRGTHHPRHDHPSALVGFVATVAAAPHVDMGLVVGAGTALVLYLLRP